MELYIGGLVAGAARLDGGTVSSAVAAYPVQGPLQGRVRRVVLRHAPQLHIVLGVPSLLPPRHKRPTGVHHYHQQGHHHEAGGEANGMRSLLHSGREQTGHLYQRGVKERGKKRDGCGNRKEDQERKIAVWRRDRWLPARGECELQFFFLALLLKWFRHVCGTVAVIGSKRTAEMEEIKGSSPTLSLSPVALDLLTKELVRHG